MRIILLFLFSFGVSFLIAQEVEEEIFSVVQERPEFPGGEKALLNYLSSSLKYPEEARLKKIQGSVVVRFIVTKSGKLDKFELVRSIGGGCDEESIRVISEMPIWVPAKNNGKPVNCRYILPIRFKLER